jgi:hypothetical protein
MCEVHADWAPMLIWRACFEEQKRSQIRRAVQESRSPSLLGSSHRTCVCVIAMR